MFPQGTELDPQDPRVAALFDFASVLLGLSYYKAAALPELTVEMPLTVLLQTSITALYTDGLGEFYVRNELPFPPKFTLVVPRKSHQKIKKGQTGPVRPLLAFGGGKDSHVSQSLLEDAGFETTFASVVLSETVAAK